MNKRKGGLNDDKGLRRMPTDALVRILEFIVEREEVRFWLLLRGLSKKWYEAVTSGLENELSASLQLHSGTWIVYDCPIQRLTHCHLPLISQTIIDSISALGISTSTPRMMDSLTGTLSQAQTKTLRVRLGGDIRSRYDLGWTPEQVISPLWRLSQQLRSLDLSQCGIIATDDSLRGIKALTALEVLNLAECKTIGVQGLAELAQLSQLRSLDLCGCTQLTDAGLIELNKGSLSRTLTTLNLKRCHQISDVGVEATVGKFSQLRSLTLSHCELLTDRSLSIVLRTCVGLTALDVSWCEKLGDGTALELVSLKAVVALRLQGCAQVTDAGLKELGCLATLTALDLSLCEALTDDTFVQLGTLSRLQTLDLHGCTNLTDRALEALSRGCPGLTKLNVNFCGKVTDAGVGALAQLRGLKLLDLGWCRLVTDLSILRLSSSAGNHLRCVNFSGCDKITNEGLEHLLHWSALRWLNLWHCALITRDRLHAIATRLPTRRLRAYTVGGDMHLGPRSTGPRKTQSSQQRIPFFDDNLDFGQQVQSRGGMMAPMRMLGATFHPINFD